MYETMDSVTKKLNKWKWSYFISLLMSGVLFLGYAGYTLLYTPERQQLLLNQMGGVYVNEDLTKTNASEGQVKQFAYESIAFSFKYNYRSLRSNEDYEKILSGEMEVDLPDHRDLIKPLFESGEHEKFLKSLNDAPWMDRFYPQHRQIDVRFSVPPLQENVNGWVQSDDGRLNMIYSGHFFIIVDAKGLKSHSYKINYKVTLERKPFLPIGQEKVYYYKPMVPMNTFEWRIKTLEWDHEKRR